MEIYRKLNDVNFYSTEITFIGSIDPQSIYFVHITKVKL